MPSPPAFLKSSSTQVVKLTLVVCLVCEGGLLALDVLLARTSTLSYPPLRQIFDLSLESSLGNFFSSVQALVVGVVLGLIGLRVKQHGRRWGARAWGLLALGFGYLALDDAAMIHERVGSFAKQLARGSWLERAEVGFGSYTWQLVLGPLFLVAGLLMLGFLLRELGRKRAFGLVLLGALCYAVAVGLDYVEGKAGSYIPLAALLRTNVDVVQHHAKALEEVTEMLGTTLFLVGFLSHLVALTPRVELDLSEDGEKPEPG